jgi:hypothetical protein
MNFVDYRVNVIGGSDNFLNNFSDVKSLAVESTRLVNALDTYFRVLCLPGLETITLGTDDQVGGLSLGLDKKQIVARVKLYGNRADVKRRLSLLSAREEHQMGIAWSNSISEMVSLIGRYINPTHVYPGYFNSFCMRSPGVKKIVYLDYGTGQVVSPEELRARWVASLPA